MNKNLTFWLVFILTLPVLLAGVLFSVGKVAFKSGRSLGADLIDWLEYK